MKNKWSVIGKYVCTLMQDSCTFHLNVCQGHGGGTKIWFWEIDAMTELISVKGIGHAASLAGAKLGALRMVPKMVPYCKKCHKEIKKEKAACKGRLWRGGYKGLIYFHYHHV